MLSRLRECAFSLSYFPQSRAGLVVILFGLFVQVKAQSLCFDPTITWWLNENGEDPCLVFERIMHRCSPNLEVFPEPSDPRDTGCFPDEPGFPDPQPCCCNPVTYSMEMACWTCSYGHKEPPAPMLRPRLEDYLRCPQRSDTLPANLSTVGAPEWAFMPLELDDRWNYFVAEAFVTGGQPPSESPPPPLPPTSSTRPVSSQLPAPTRSSSSPASNPAPSPTSAVPTSNAPPSQTSGPRPPTATSGNNTNSGPNVAVIAGVTAAGVICLIFVLLAIFLLLRRRKWLMKKSDSILGGVAPSSFWSRSVIDRRNRRDSFSVYGVGGGGYDNGGGPATTEVRSVRPPPLVIQPISIPPAAASSTAVSAYPDDGKTSAGPLSSDTQGHSVFPLTSSEGVNTAVPQTAATAMTPSTYANYPMPIYGPPLSPGALTRARQENRSNPSLTNSSSTGSSNIVFNPHVNPSVTRRSSSASGLGLIFSPTASVHTIALPRGAAPSSTPGHVPRTLQEEEEDAGVILQLIQRMSPATSLRYMRPPPSYRDEWNPERH